MILRDVRDEDLDTFFEHWIDPESNRVAAFTAKNPNDREAFDARWSRLRANDEITSRTIEVDGVVVGVISSWTQDGDREVTYWLGREHWGKGLATRALEAFLEVETTRPLHAAAAADNAGSIRVLEKCGFERTGDGPTTANGGVEELVLKLDR